MVELNGRMVDMDVVVSMMDDEIREDIHNRIAPCTEQEFVNAYVVAHQAKYGEEFDI